MGNWYKVVVTFTSLIRNFSKSYHHWWWGGIVTFQCTLFVFAFDHAHTPQLSISHKTTQWASHGHLGWVLARLTWQICLAKHIVRCLIALTQAIGSNILTRFYCNACKPSGAQHARSSENCSCAVCTDTLGNTLCRAYIWQGLPIVQECLLLWCIIMHHIQRKLCTCNVGSTHYHCTVCCKIKVPLGQRFPDLCA